MLHNISGILFLLSLCKIAAGQIPTCSCDLEDFTDPLPRIVQIDPISHQFTDEFGRTSWFRGTNVVSKSFPYHPRIGGSDVCNHTFDTPLCNDDMDYLQQIGVNLVRLGVMWPGAEPNKGEYNCQYFCVIHQIIRSLAERGIYTLVDVHQDVLARQFCQEGVPDWFVQKDWISNESHRFPYPQAQPFTVDEMGIPSPISQCWEIGADWFLSYFSFAVSDAFQKFYSNHDGLLDSFAAYWKKIAEEFKDYSSVLGYNLLNEPWAGGIYDNPALLIPGIADRINLENAWNVTTASIRSVDSSTIIFFEGVTWDVTSEFSPFAPEAASKTALSYHFYSPPQLGLHVMFTNRLKDLEHLGIGGMLTEFRAWAAEGDEDPEVIDGRMRSTVEAADKYLQSWIGWGFGSIVDRSTSVALHYARTYASAVAGSVVETSFNEHTAEFRLSWIINTDILQPSEIKLNKRLYYSHGFEVTTEPQGWCNISETSNGLLRVFYSSEAEDGETARLLISPKDSSPTGPPTPSPSASANIINTTSKELKATTTLATFFYLICKLMNV